MPERTRPLSRKARRLRITTLTLTAVAVVGGTAAISWYVLRTPEPYTPGEEHAEITRVLAEGLPPGAPEPLLTDVTAEAGLSGFVHFVGARTSQLPEDMGSGAAWGDFDADGDEDLFVVSGGGALTLAPDDRAPSRLYENLGDGRFGRVEGFPEPRILGMGAAWGDAEGDGDLDLVVTGYRSLMLYRNDGGSWAADDRLGEHDGYWSGAAWGDFDRDGDLDLYVCGYVRYVEAEADRARATIQYGRSVPYTLNPASYEPERNLLFVNDGAGRFSEQAEAYGVINSEGRSLGALWHDFDDDGLFDLYVANDISDNAFFRNTGEGFEELAHPAWFADYRGAMGMSAGDWNRDGDDDLFITHWIAQENALYDSLLAQQSTATEPPTDSPVRFVDVADQRGLGQIALRSVGWGTEFVDLDADGWLDLVVTNGSTFETEDSPPGLVPQLPFLFWSEQGRRFHDLAPLDAALSVPRVGRGLALADYDNDGDRDLLFVDHSSGVRLLRNDMQAGNWIELRLRSRGPDGGPRGWADGSVLEAQVGEVVLRRTINSASYLSQSSRVVHIGLGEATVVDRLLVHWPDGELASFEGLAAGSFWELSQDQAAPRRVVADPLDVAGALGRRSLDAPRNEREKERLARFWTTQRSAMNAMKIDDDCARAVELFRQALELRPHHTDSIYYLATCQARLGDPDEAISLLENMTSIDPQTHRGYKQLGILRAMSAESAAELERAKQALERSLEINKEETGSLLVLGEIAILQGEPEEAERRLAWACRTNPQAVGGFYLRAYVAWSAGEHGRAEELLKQARTALGEEWKPEGTTAEGDVEHKMHEDQTPLSRFWESWDGAIDPNDAFGPLDRYLSTER